MNMVTICNNCGTHNSQDAAFCRNCGRPLSDQIDNNKPRWRTFLIGLSLIMIFYGLLAFFTCNSEIDDQHYTGYGHYDYVTTKHSDALGLITSTGVAFNMTMGTSLDSIIEDSMTDGRHGYYIICICLIILGGCILGISTFVRQKKRKSL